MRDERSRCIVDKRCENPIDRFWIRFGWSEDLPSSSSLGDENLERRDAGGMKHACDISVFVALAQVRFSRGSPKQISFVCYVFTSHPLFFLVLVGGWWGGGSRRGRDPAHLGGIDHIQYHPQKCSLQRRRDGSLQRLTDQH